MDAMDHQGDTERLLTAFEGLSREDASAAIEQLRAVLTSLPVDHASVADRLLRARLEAFLAGYAVGCREVRD